MPTNANKHIKTSINTYLGKSINKLFLFFSLLALVITSTLGGLLYSSLQNSSPELTASAGVNFYCPPGATLQGSTCTIGKIQGCPNGGVLTNNLCVATGTNPINLLSKGCVLGGTQTVNYPGFGFKGATPQNPSFASYYCVSPATYTFDYSNTTKTPKQYLRSGGTFYVMSGDYNFQSANPEYLFDSADYPCVSSPYPGRFGMNLSELKRVGPELDWQFTAPDAMHRSNLNGANVCGGYMLYGKGYKDAPVRDCFLNGIINNSLPENNANPCGSNVRTCYTYPGEHGSTGPLDPADRTCTYRPSDTTPEVLNTIFAYWPGDVRSGSFATEPTSCPAGFTDAGANCTMSAQPTSYTVDSTSVGTFVCNPNPTNPGRNVDCVAPLYGAQPGQYVLPSEGVYAAIRNINGDMNSSLGNSNLCIIPSNTATLVCNNVPVPLNTNLGDREVVGHRPGVEWMNNKGVLRVEPIVNLITSTDITSSTCTPTNPTWGDNVTCTAVITPGKTGTITFTTNPNVGTCTTAIIATTATSASCTFLTQNPGTTTVTANPSGGGTTPSGDLNINNINRTVAPTLDKKFVVGSVEQDNLTGVAPGSSIVERIYYSNTGSTAGTGASVKSQLPAGFNVQSIKNCINPSTNEVSCSNNLDKTALVNGSNQLQVSPVAGLYDAASANSQGGTATNATAGVLEIGKFKYIHEYLCLVADPALRDWYIPGKNQDGVNNNPTLTPAQINATNTALGCTAGGGQTSFDTLNNRYIHEYLCITSDPALRDWYIPGLNEEGVNNNSMLTNQQIADLNNRTGCASESTQTSFDMLGQRFIHEYLCLYTNNGAYSDWYVPGLNQDGVNNNPTLTPSQLNAYNTTLGCTSGSTQTSFDMLDTTRSKGYFEVVMTAPATINGTTQNFTQTASLEGSNFATQSDTAQITVETGVTPTCTNGATNYPSCNVCPSPKIFVSGNCINPSNVQNTDLTPYCSPTTVTVGFNVNCTAEFTPGKTGTITFTTNPNTGTCTTGQISAQDSSATCAITTTTPGVNIPVTATASGDTTTPTPGNAGTITVNAAPCTNGAINPPACNVCPTGQTFVNNICRTPTTIDLPNIGNCATQIVTIPSTYNCTFPLVGDANNFYQLPSAPIKAHTGVDATGTNPLANSASDDCTLVNNQTAQAALQCNTLKSVGATAGIKNVLVTVGNLSPADRGDVNLQAAVIPVTPIKSTDITSASCAPTTVFVGQQVTCTGNFTPGKSGTITFTTNPNTGTCTTPAISPTDTSASCIITTTTPGNDIPVSAKGSGDPTGAAPALAGTITVNAAPCSNGAINPPACNTCPTGSSLINNVCVNPTIIDFPNISNCPTQNVTIPNTYNCTFPLIGDPNNFYQLPSAPIKAHTGLDNTSVNPLPNSVSDDCTLINNQTAQAALECKTLKSISSTPGTKNVLVTIGGSVPQDKGDVVLVDTTTPLTPIKSTDITSASCTPTTVFVGQQVTCTANFTPGKTGTVTFTTNPNTGTCVAPVVSGTAVSASCQFTTTTPGNDIPVSATGSGDPTGAAPASAGTITVNAAPCTNGAINPPACNICPTGSSLVNNVCVTTPAGTTSPLTPEDIKNIPITCNNGQSVLVNSTTTCTFNLPSGKTLPDDTKLGIDGAAPAGTCTANGLVVTCINVPTGSLLGLQPVSAQIGNSPVVQTTSKVNVISSDTVRTGGSMAITVVSSGSIITGMLFFYFKNKKRNSAFNI